MEQDKETADKPKQGDERETEFYYENAGIRERYGTVPLWLWAVAVALVIWGVYYLMAYWSPPA